MFLLYDFVHLLKSVRNNWITEKSQKLRYEYDGKTKYACWSSILSLFKLEGNNIVKLSKLTSVSVAPKPIERQKVSTCLKVFCDETATALKSNSGIKEADGTITFIEIFVRFWKIVNVKGPYADIRYKDPDRAVISTSEDARLAFLLSLATMVEQMSSKQGNRQFQLTRDTGAALAHTCRGLVAITKFLLQHSFKYVILGKFTTDPLEKMFGKLRQGSGGTYFINVQNIIEKVKIQRAKLSLHIGIDIDFLSAESAHNCQKCGYFLSSNAIDIFDNLPELEKCLQIDTKAGLVYIAGYIVRNEVEEQEEAKFYYGEFGDYTAEINRGGLKIPNDNVCQWTIFSYILFLEIVSRVCQKSNVDIRVF